MSQCPKCGTWCEPEKRSIIQKAGDGFTKTKDSFARIGGAIGEKIGGKDGKTVGEMIGDSISNNTPAPLIGAASEALIGDKYVFVCPQCGNKWTIDGDEASSKIKKYVDKAKTSIEEKPIIRTANRWLNERLGFNPSQNSESEE